MPSSGKTTQTLTHAHTPHIHIPAATSSSGGGGNAFKFIRNLFIRNLLTFNTPTELRSNFLHFDHLCLLCWYICITIYINISVYQCIPRYQYVSMIVNILTDVNVYIHIYIYIQQYISKHKFIDISICIHEYESINMNQ